MRRFDPYATESDSDHHTDNEAHSHHSHHAATAQERAVLALDLASIRALRSTVGDVNVIIRLLPALCEALVHHNMKCDAMPDVLPHFTEAGGIGTETMKEYFTAVLQLRDGKASVVKDVLDVSLWPVLDLMPYARGLIWPTDKKMPDERSRQLDLADRVIALVLSALPASTTGHASAFNTLNYDQRTPLLYAIEADHGPETVRALMDRGGVFSEAELRGGRALYSTVTAPNMEVMELVLDSPRQGAALSDRINTPLDFKIFRAGEGLVPIKHCTALQQCCLLAPPLDVDLRVRKLIEMGADPSMENLHGWTAIKILGKRFDMPHRPLRERATFMNAWEFLEAPPPPKRAAAASAGAAAGAGRGPSRPAETGRW